MIPNDLLPLLPDLATFAHVVDAGNFSAAARRLGTTPSTVSRQMQRLERALGARLLERSTRSVRTTEAGAQVARYCRDIVDAAAGALDAAAEQRARPRGRIAVSAPISIAKSVVHPLIADFLRTYPEVDVQLIFADRDVDPLREPVDLVIRPTPAPPPGLAGRQVGSVRWMPCASPVYLRVRGTPRAPADLAQHDCLYLGDAADDHRWTFRRDAQTRTVEVRGRYVANDALARCEAALDGWGIASLPEFVAADALRAGTLVRVLPDWSFEPRAYSGPVWLLYPPNRFLPPKVRVFIDWLTERMPTGGPGHPHG